MFKFDPQITALSFEVPLSLLRAREAALERLRPTLRAAGITEAEWRLMETLAQGAKATGGDEHEAAIDVGDLAKRMGARKQNAERIAKRLVAGGHLMWSRRGRLRLAPRGLLLLDDIVTACPRTWADVDYPPGDRKRLGVLLDNVRRAAEDDSPPTNFAVPGEDIADLRFGLPLVLLKTRDALLARLRPAFRRFDFTEPQWRCLRIFARHGFLPFNRSQIANAGCFHLTKVQAPINYLRERELILFDLRRRRRSQNRKRLRFAEAVSESGQRMIEIMDAEITARCRPLIRALPGAELMELDRLLERLTESLLLPTSSGEAPFSPFAAEYALHAARAAVSARRWREWHTGWGRKRPHLPEI